MQHKTTMSVVFLLIGLLFSCQGTSLFYEASLTVDLYYYDALFETTIVDGFIIENQAVNGGFNTTFRFVTYIPDRGIQVFTNEDRTRGFKVGEKVPVRYLTLHPSISEIVWTNPYVKDKYLEERYSVPLIVYCGLGSIILPYALLSMVRSVIAAVRTRHKSVMRNTLHNEEKT